MSIDSALVEIPPDECLLLLRTQPVGRVAVPVPDGAPLVIPVNYVVDDGVIVFRSNPGSKLRLMEGGPISFEVDYVDAYHRTGWSVLAQGRAHGASAAEV